MRQGKLNVLQRHHVFAEIELPAAAGPVRDADAQNAVLETGGNVPAMKFGVADFEFAAARELPQQIVPADTFRGEMNFSGSCAGPAIRPAGRSPGNFREVCGTHVRGQLILGKRSKNSVQGGMKIAIGPLSLNISRI